jgi:hypothetical protein
MRYGIAITTLAACVALCAATGEAQFRRGGGIGGGNGGDPDYWVGLDYGYQGGMTVYDATGAEWDIGYTSQLRATIAKTLAHQLSVGVAAGFSTPTLTYYPGNLGSGNSFSCSFDCTAKADVTQWLAFVHYGSGLGFHGVYSIEAGITQFGNFREQSTGDQLPPSSSSNDFTFGLGGGAGYGFTPTIDGFIAENFDLVMHSEGANVTNDAPRFFTFRIGFRAGF